MTTPILAQRYALTHAQIPLDRLRMVALAGPHGVYSEPDTRRAVASELRALFEGHMTAQH